MKTEAKYNYSDLYELCHWYVENEGTNEKIYNLCVEYFFNRTEMTTIKKDMLLNYFDKI
ncbi:MAG: hypothetical protein WCR72_16980 [Bacteroidota bacterium]